MRRRIMFCLFISMLIIKANGQSLTVETYAHQLFFNIFRDRPDTSVKNFLGLYVPSLLKKTDTVVIAGAKPAFEIHSFVFTKHPFFNPAFSNGRLEFYCQRFPEPKGVQVYDVKLWFDFDSQEKAEMAYSKLIETFSPISTNQKKFSVQGAMVAQFTDSRGAKGFNKIQIRLTADNLDHHNFKILVELGNDLD